MAPLGAVQLAIVSSVTTTMVIIAMSLRLWSKHLQNHRLAIHDYLAVVGMFFTAATVTVFVAGGFVSGLGIHAQEVMATAPEKLALHVQLYIPFQLLWAAANSCVKGSILSFYIALFPNKTFIRLCYGTMIATALYLVLVLVETFGLFRPLQYTWDKTINGECAGEDPVYLIVGLVNFFIDTFILVLPMPLVFRLQMTLTKRLSVAGMFSVGSLICIISLPRTIWVHTWDQSDLTYNGTPGAIYHVLEPTLGVVNACLPTMKPAFTKLFGSRPGSTASHDPQVLRGVHKKVKGNITRDLERLNDEFASYEIRIETDVYAETDSDSCGSSNIRVDRVFDVSNSATTAPRESVPAYHGSKYYVSDPGQTL